MEPEVMKTIEELEKNLGKHSLVWEEIAPKEIINWLDLFSKSNGCSKELILLNMMAATGALLGDSTVELFGNWKEHGHLFLLGLAPSGMLLFWH